MSSSGSSNSNSNLTERLKAGRQLLRAAHRAGDAAKLGNLRAGNSGIMSENGDVAGACHRVAHLRALGIELEEPTDSKLVMFQMGTANEDVVYHDLVQTSAPDEVILREEEIPISWLTSNGTKVTGRPDMVICKKGEIVSYDYKGESLTYTQTGDAGSTTYKITPKWGVELKSVASVWTSRDILSRHPKMANLIQAAHYSWKLGVPFRLMYKQYGIQEIPSWKGAGGSAGWTQKLFPRQGEPGSECIDYEKGRIQPYELTFELSWSRSGALRYREEGTGERDPVTGDIRQDGSWTTTLVRTADIERFYEAASRIGETGDLGKRPLTIDSQGKEKSYSNCSFCPLQKICDKVDKPTKARPKMDYANWLSEVRTLSTRQIPPDSDTTGG